jgi:pimeloyl-ACP methyl ester carboxylesterase
MPFAAGMYYSTFEGGSREDPAVVLIHGAGGDHLYWPAEFRRIPGYRILVPDLPGHGRFSGSGRQSIWAYAAQLVFFLEELGLSQAVFIGHSMGGCIVLALGLEHSRNVTAMGLISTGAHIDIPAEIIENTASPATFPLAVSALGALIFSPYTNHKLVERGISQLSKTRPGVLYGDLLACQTFDIVDRVHEIQSPALVMCGSEDKLAPTHYSQFLASQLGSGGKDREGSFRTRLEIIPSAGHAVILEQPQVVKTCLVPFLKSVYRS